MDGRLAFDDELPPCGSFVGHDGAAPGYDATAFSNVEGTRQYAVLTNNLAPGDVVGNDEAQQAFNDLIIHRGVQLTRCAGRDLAFPPEA